MLLGDNGVDSVGDADHVALEVRDEQFGGEPADWSHVSKGGCVLRCLWAGARRVFVGREINTYVMSSQLAAKPARWMDGIRSCPDPDAPEGPWAGRSGERG